MVTYKIILHNLLDKTGKAQLYLQFFVFGKRLRIPLRISILPEHWNAQKQKIKPAEKHSKELNLLLEQEKARVNTLLVNARLSGSETTLDSLLHEYHNPDIKFDFLKFMDREITLREGIVSQGAIRHHKSIHNKLCEFSGGKLKFAEFNLEFIEAFEKHLLTTGINSSTLWSNMKNIKTYANRAVKKGIRFKNPFDYYKLHNVRGNRTSLSKEELTRLFELYNRPYLPFSWREVLQCFLFACVAGGIRFGDLRKLNRKNIVNDTLVYTPDKTIKQNKRSEIPLTQVSVSLLEPEGAEIFKRIFSEAYTNRVLKDIASHLKINKRVSFHVSRHTFATMFLSAGGQLPILQNILLHSKIETTMVYEHLNEQAGLKGRQMQVMADFLASA